MKKSGYELKIENPCSADWSEMSATEKGRFCTQCEKTVIDFTKFSDDAVIKLLEQNKGSMCGRLHNSQLERYLVKTQTQKQNPYSARFIAGLLLFAVPETFFAQKPEFITITSPTDEGKKVVSPEKENSLTEQKFQEDNSVNNIIFGKVVLGNEEIVGATVMIRQTTIATITDLSGRFHLKIPAYFLEKDKVNLAVDYLGYEPYYFSVDKKTISANKEILINIMEEKSFTMGKMMICQPKILPILLKDVIVPQIETNNLLKDVTVPQIKTIKWWQFWKSN